MKIKICLLLASIFLIGCNKSDDDYIYTLYSSYRDNRRHVATFDMAPVANGEKFKQYYEGENFTACKKVANLMEADWKNTVNTNELTYWCEKGRFKK